MNLILLSVPDGAGLGVVDIRLVHILPLGVDEGLDMTPVFRLGVKRRAGRRSDLSVGDSLACWIPEPAMAKSSPASTGDNDLRGTGGRNGRLFPRAGTQIPGGRDGLRGRGRGEGASRRGVGDGPQGGGRLATSEHDGREVEWRGSNDTKDKWGIPKKENGKQWKVELGGGTGRR